MLQWQFKTKVSSIYVKIKYHSYTHIMGVCLWGRERKRFGEQRKRNKTSNGMYQKTATHIFFM